MQTVATDLRNLAKTCLVTGRFDDAATTLARLTAAETQVSCGQPHPRFIAAAWVEIAEAAADGDRALLAGYLGEAEHRYAPHAFAVPRIAELTGAPVAAREALRDLLRRDPTDVQARASLVRLLVRSDLLEEAEREIETCVTNAAPVDTIEALRGLVAVRKQDWTVAQSIWASYAQRHPQDRIAANTLDRVNLVRQLAQAEEAFDGARPFPIASDPDNAPEHRQLLLRFESIGTDCEFGSVQRIYGAEPLGLFRWTATDMSSLLRALAARFAGIGDPENTELVVLPTGHICLHDVRWGFPMHTFLFETEVNLAALHPKMCRRMAFLRDKFVRDLRAAEKTLVFKSDLADRSELFRLHDAFRTFGPIRLLNVRTGAPSRDFPADEPGSVREMGPGLFVGRLPPARTGNLPLAEWTDICRGVERLISDETRKHGLA